MPGDPISAITEAAAVLGEHPALAPIAEYLLGYPSELLEHMTGAENGVGRSVRVEAVLAKRNALLRQLGEIASPVPLAAELKRYYGRAWQRDRVKATNPYRDGDRRATLWQVLRLRPAPVSVRYLRVILRT
jgi:hypothetical protein